jgi:rhamnosyltransferase
MSKKCSIIIRTKNEERWVVPCLKAVYAQTYKNFEVVIVDNESSDKTVEKTKIFKGIKYVNIKDYLPGKSLNAGIQASSGDYIVCLSAHCIPVNNLWLEGLVTMLEEDDNYAGVYGRQEPMSFSSPGDKRDLLLVFGLDKKIQMKDSFFHNANSILRRELWEIVPFDNQTTNIEDRLWAAEMLNLEFKLAYNPDASVYHYHGIHQDGNKERCNNVVRIIQDMNSSSKSEAQLDAKSLNIVAIIPIKDEDGLIGNKHQMTYTINSALESKYIESVFVSTNNKSTADLALNYGAECPFLRTENLAMPYIGLDTVLKDFILNLEKSGVYPDLVVILEETFPFRKKGLVDEMIDHILINGLDTLVAAQLQSGSLWHENENSTFTRIDSGDAPRAFKEKSFIGLKGLCCISHPELIRHETIFNSNIGLFEVDSPLASFEVRNQNDRQIAAQLLDNGFIF